MCHEYIYMECVLYLIKDKEERPSVPKSGIDTCLFLVSISNTSTYVEGRQRRSCLKFTSSRLCRCFAWFDLPPKAIEPAIHECDICGVHSLKG